MIRARFALRLVAVLTFSLVNAPWVHAQATVETGGTTGAATNLPPLVPDFTGMSSTITGTAATSPGPTEPQASDPAQMTAPEDAEPQAPASDEDPDQPETSGDG